jgi:hypothetical protein
LNDRITGTALFRIYVVAWIASVVVFTLISVFPFGFVFGAIIGIPVGFLATFLYVQLMNLVFGNKDEKELGEKKNKGFDYNGIFDNYGEEDRE